MYGNRLRSLDMVLENISEKDSSDLNVPIGTPLRYGIDSEGRVLEHGYLE